MTRRNAVVVGTHYTCEVKNVKQRTRTCRHRRVDTQSVFETCRTARRQNILTEVLKLKPRCDVQEEPGCVNGTEVGI